MEYKSVGLIIAICMVLLSMVSGEALSAAAEVVSVQGDGQFRIEDRDPWKDARVEQDLFAGNFVRTGDYSRMGLLFSDRTQIRLNEKTLLQIKQVRAPSEGKESTILRLNLGRTWSQSKSLPDGLIMETPSATAAIRGTQWELSVDESGNSTLTVLSGEVEFYNDFGRIVVEANEQARAEVGKAPVKTLLVDPRERVQWVSAYEVNPLRHIVMYSENLQILENDLEVLSGNGVETRAARGVILADLGRWNEAEMEFDAVLEDQPNHTGALIGLGFSALRQGNLDEAEFFFNRMTPGAQDYDAELLNLGRASMGILSEDLRLAFDLLNSIVRESGLERPAAHLILSDIMVYNGDIASAVDPYN